ncbi:MAG: hypothetical protein RDV48_10035 [Candidatus Eremiobacteraeota bacterium]|nr:hypothetical protein [Candidatus Eremiobacteraeota bacterium]
MADVFDIILLLALPASGKSETRTFIAAQEEKAKKEIFHLGKDAQMDDFLYVHLMRCIDVELKKAGGDYVFFHAPDKTFKEAVSWGVLTLLLSDDYEQLIDKHGVIDTKVEDLYRRIDDARARLNAKPIFYSSGKPLIDEDKLRRVADALREEYRKMQEERETQIPKDMTGATLIIEFARGGAEGSSMPLSYGYEYNLKLLTPKILEKAAILYVWVTPEESRRKNREREDPNDPGSILAHGVPEEVMRKEYGCDDIEHLMGKSDQEGFIKVERPERSYYLPIQRFDNRKDKTSFVRSNVWKDEDSKALYDGLSEACIKLYEKYRSQVHPV